MVDSAADRLISATRRGAPATAVVYGALCLQTLLAAATLLVAKRTLLELHPLPLLAARFLLSGFLFCLLLAAMPGSPWPPRRSWAQILYLGFLAGPLNQGLLFWGHGSA